MTPKSGTGIAHYLDKALQYEGGVYEKTVILNFSSVDGWLWLF